MAINIEMLLAKCRHRVLMLISSTECPKTPMSPKYSTTHGPPLIGTIFTDSNAMENLNMRIPHPHMCHTVTAHRPLPMDTIVARGTVHRHMASHTISPSTQVKATNRRAATLGTAIVVVLMANGYHMDKLMVVMIRHHPRRRLQYSRRVKTARPAIPMIPMNHH
jgi:hypothetical protein